MVGIALRTVRLHRANELALQHTVRMQEVAGLAGHDLDRVLSSVAEQARTTYQALHHERRLAQLEVWLAAQGVRGR